MTELYKALDKFSETISSLAGSIVILSSASKTNSKTIVQLEKRIRELEERLHYFEKMITIPRQAPLFNHGTTIPDYPSE